MELVEATEVTPQQQLQLMEQLIPVEVEEEVPIVVQDSTVLEEQEDQE